MSRGPGSTEFASVTRLDLVMRGMGGHALAWLSGGPGASVACAFVLAGPSLLRVNVRLEYWALRRLLGEYHVTAQETFDEEGRTYDRLEVLDAAGALHTLYFDITALVRAERAAIDRTLVRLPHGASRSGTRG
jgi:hypothetical protein